MIQSNGGDAGLTREALR